MLVVVALASTVLMTLPGLRLVDAVAGVMDRVRREQRCRASIGQRVWSEMQMQAAEDAVATRRKLGELVPSEYDTRAGGRKADPCIPV